MTNVNLTLIEQCPRDAVMFDIGANQGRYTVPMAKFPERKVYAFEPETSNIEVLKEHVTKSYARDRIEIQEVALSNKSGSQKLHLNFGNPGGHTLREQLVGKFGVTEDHTAVLSVKLDDWCKKKKIKRVDGIKIDVEGHEKEVIEGGMETLKKFRPRIALETHATIDVEGLKKLLQECGYDVSDLKHNGAYYLEI